MLEKVWVATVWTLYKTEVFEMKYLIITQTEFDLYSIEGVPVYVSGVGKLSAAMSVLEIIEKYKPDLIINYGIVESYGKLKPHVLTPIGMVCQSDMNYEGWGFVRGETPYKTESLILKASNLRDVSNTYLLGSQDSYVPNMDSLGDMGNLDVDMLDSEAYAILKVCQSKGVEFHCYKYSSCKEDKISNYAWTSLLDQGSDAFLEVINKKYGASDLHDS